jgi:anti-sigma factor (TIGR02949 family)
VSGYAFDPCERCEEMMQPYLDRELTVEEMAEAEAHLDGCAYCRRRYRFEVSLRRYMRTAVSEPMPPELKAKLSQLRIELS